MDKRFGTYQGNLGSSRAVVLLPIVWLTLSLAVTLGFIRMEYATAAEQLLRKARNLHSHIQELQQSNLAVLGGFSAMLGVMDHLDRPTIAQYAQRMLSLYPQIFMLEVVERVPAERLAEFERRQQQEWHPGFRIRAFSYDGQRNWVVPPAKREYYPIVFIEPRHPGSEQVLGLDTDAVPFLRAVMAESRESGQPATSHPFHLVEGHRALVMHRPAHPDNALSALLVVRADALVRAPWLVGMEHLDLSLHHRDFAADADEGSIWRRLAAPASAAEAWLLPRQQLQLQMRDAGIPFVLTVDKQFRWHDWNVAFIVALVFGQGAVFAVLLVFAREHLGRERERRENEARLAYLASHDGLTGLPNRNLLLDRLGQAIKRARRQQSRFALLFLDLDCFKQVNDTYGHDAGDQLLVALAHGITGAVRAQDTVARLSGDEFVVLAEQLHSRGEGEQVAEKVAAAVRAALGKDYLDLGVDVSLGMALYPDDGEGAHALLRLADGDMYTKKRSRKPCELPA